MTVVPFAAVVFDLDGTLVDSEQVSRAAMAEVLAEDGHELTDDEYHAMVGGAWPQTAARLRAMVGYDDDGLERYLVRWDAAFTDRLDDVRMFPDAADVLAALRSNGVPVAVCTSSGRRHLDRVLAAVDLVGTFAATVSRQDTEEHKPHPAPYLRTVELLGVDARRSVALEDSVAGVASARAAGLAVVGVDRGMGFDLVGAHAVVERLDLSVIDGVGGIVRRT